MQIAAAFAGSALLPIDLFAKYTYTTPQWSQVASVGPMSHATTLMQFNLFCRQRNGDADYIRAISVLEAAPNVSEQDIINEFRLKSNDNNALITTVGVEDNYHLFERQDQSFRKHLTVGQVKELIKNNREYQVQSHNMSEYRRVEGKYPRKWREWVDGNVIKQHTVFDSGKESYREVKLYSLEVFAHEMVSSTKRTKKLEAENHQWTRSNLRKRLREDYYELSSAHGAV